MPSMCKNNLNTWQPSKAALFNLFWLIAQPLFVTLQSVPILFQIQPKFQRQCPGKCDFFFSYCLFGNWFILINGSRSVYYKYNNEVIVVESTYWRTVLKILACWWNNPNQTAVSACWTLSGYLQARLDPTTLSKGYPLPMARMDHPKLSGCRGRLQCQRRWSEGWKKVV